VQNAPVAGPRAPVGGAGLGFQQRQVQPNRTFGGPAGAPLRQFGSSVTQSPGGQNQRRFGAAGGTPSGSIRTFGASGVQGGPSGERHFGVASAGQPGGERHFGVASVGQPGGERHFGAAPGGPGGRSFHTASLSPHRSSSGRVFDYHGHAYGRFAVARYHWPHGYGYHRYAIGYRLPRAYWLPDYFITDYVDYGLDPPPDDFEWIRYGPDILLINQDTGEIAQVIYGVFDESDDAVAEDDGDQGAPGN